METNQARIAYFTTEFPGQTHIFLWREYCELLKIGIKADLLSTRNPPEGIVAHSWSSEAREKTTYLMPLKLSDAGAIIKVLSRSRAKQWRQIKSIFCSASDLSFKEKVSLFALLLIAAKVVALAESRAWTHIHSTTCGNAANIAMFVSCLSDITYSLSLLGPKLETYGKNQRNKWRYASFGLFQSYQLLHDAEHKLNGCIPKLHDFAPVGVNIDVMKRAGDDYQPWRGGSCHLYSCGRLHPIKGHEYVIDAVTLLRERGYDVHLTIGGEDIEGGTGHRKNIEQKIHQDSLGSYVTLLGAVSEEANREQLSRAHVYVMGSLDEAAGAVAAMEAMSMELPVVMPDVGATAELIETEKEGLLVNSKSARELADAIERLLQSPELAAQLGQAGRRKIANKFNHHLSADTIARFLQQVSSEDS